ncbi:hypothetical protein CTAYLR_001565 [Chrysophaeum taylorii]|uniref:NAD-dependent epimerase/dehydratase domain-containing protein n=1 Tax=Chrysophaeum taylorii TaxID=2483200 RepID=A0AAD7XP44_9STRA|nr:hypothetical protein CTAYLR_001565 [Chrysophaeum taylorii]
MGKVCVTGASGYIASHIVQQLLTRGHVVHGTVRDVANSAKTAHLSTLEGAEKRLRLFSADLVTGGFEAAVLGCDGVIHTATPVMLTAEDGETEIFEPAMAGLEHVLAAIDRAPEVKSFVLLSSTAAVAPEPRPAVVSEEHWSDPQDKREQGKWYGCAKTTKELKAREWAAARPLIRYVAINPTLVVGPMLQPGLNESMRILADIVTGARMMTAPNDSFSFVDVRDCAAMHVAAYERDDVTGRHLCVAESLHWNDIFATLKEIYPAVPDVQPYRGGGLVAPIKFDTTKQQKSLLDMALRRSTRDILVDAVAELQNRGFLAT